MKQCAKSWRMLLTAKKRFVSGNGLLKAFLVGG